MTNKPMLSVEQELRGAVEKALLAIKRIYQAGHDGIVNAGGSCDQPSVMFEGDPTVREIRALLDKPVIEPKCHCAPLRFPFDANCPVHSAQHQGEPVAVKVSWAAVEPWYNENEQMLRDVFRFEGLKGVALEVWRAARLNEVKP